MPTIITHAVCAAALASMLPRQTALSKVVALGALCAVAPDVDVFGSRFGIRYEDLWGHRGLTHSLMLAIAFSLLALVGAFPIAVGSARRLFLWLYFLGCTTSHDLLDAFTDGGLGVAFLSPFDSTRYFFPFRPIAVSPIGVRFFSDRGIRVLWSEFVCIWIPLSLFAIATLIIQRWFPRKSEA